MRDKINYSNKMQNHIIKHIIKKLTFSLHFHSGAQVRQLEQDVINIYRKQVEQLLDEHFSKLSGSDVEYHIAELELDLGRIKPENLRLEMPRRISEQLSKILNNGLACTSDIISEQEKQLSLFSHFLETGRAPWWAERLHRKTLGQLTEKLCINSPTELKGLLLHVIKDERTIRRLINQLPDQCLYSISELYLSAHYVVLIARQYGDIVALFTEVDREKAIRDIYAPMQLSAGYANDGRIKLRGHYWQNVLISVAYGPANAFSCDQLLLDTLVSFTSNNDEAYCSLVTGLNNAVGLLKDSGYKFRSRLPDLLAEFSKETANLPEDAVPVPGGSEPDEYMGLTEPATAINTLSSKKRVISERALTGAARQTILRGLVLQGDTRDRRGLIRGSSTKRNTPSSKKRVTAESALSGAERQTTLWDLVSRGNVRDRRSLITGLLTRRDASSSKRMVISQSILSGAERRTILRDLVLREDARDRHRLVTGSSTRRNVSSSNKRAISARALTGAARQTILRDLVLREEARDRHRLVTGSSTRRNTSSSKKRVTTESALSRAERRAILRGQVLRGDARDRRGLIRGSSTKRNASSSRKRVISARALTGTARQKVLQNSSVQERPGVQPETIKDPFTDSNEDYIYNAGLVIVWPYLPRLFLNLGMVENGNFINMDTAERAALLLQYLVEPDTEMPESLLSLNKLLCGFELSWPLPADFTPTEREQGECDALLKAVTCHWDVLKNMSFERVRLDFFQRQGVLSARAGNWLLQVEQQTHDILMQKLPWPIGVVKLPWMDCALLVDWG